MDWGPSRSGIARAHRLCGMRTWAIYRPHWRAASLRCDRAQADTPEAMGAAEQGDEADKA